MEVVVDQEGVWCDSHFGRKSGRLLSCVEGNSPFLNKPMDHIFYEGVKEEHSHLSLFTFFRLFR